VDPAPNAIMDTRPGRYPGRVSLLRPKFTGELPKSKELGLPVSSWAIPAPAALSVWAAPALPFPFALIQLEQCLGRIHIPVMDRSTEWALPLPDPQGQLRPLHQAVGTGSRLGTKDNVILTAIYDRRIAMIVLMRSIVFLILPKLEHFFQLSTTGNGI
jgi:hypothetical protein